MKTNYLEVCAMQVRIYTREEVETLLRQEFRDKVAVISFYDLGTEPVDISSTSYEAIQISAEDIELDTLDLHGFTYETYFPEAEVLAHFVFYAKTAGLEIICQCESGRGLSAGCAAAIRQFFDRDGIEVFANYDYSPNRLIYHKILNALIAESFERGEVYYRIKSCAFSIARNNAPAPQ